MSDLDSYQQRPEDLMTAAIAAAINPSSGVTIDDITLSIENPGTVLVIPASQTQSETGWLYYGHAEASYAPIDLGALLGSFELRLMVAMPATTMDIVNILNPMFNLAITEADVVNEVIPGLTQSGMTYLVKASPTSTMWAGQRAVKLYPVTLPPSGS